MNPTRSFPFNIRVYGIYINNGRVLVSDERIGDRDITKFPGGGLHYGEGTADCIRREMLEETGQPFEVLRHFYTTDFFQESAFRPGHQVISIYYLLATQQPLQFRIAERPFDYSENSTQSFRWVDAGLLKSDVFTLPIDQVVGELLEKLVRSGAMSE